MSEPLENCRKMVRDHVPKEEKGKRGKGKERKREIEEEKKNSGMFSHWFPITKGNTKTPLSTTMILFIVYFILILMYLICASKLNKNKQ